MSNNQSDGVNKLKRIEFSFNGKSYKFLLNPEEYRQPESNRANVTQTKGGAFIDEFGAGIVTIQLKGTTGLKSGSKKGNKGFEKFKELRDLVRGVYDRSKAGEIVPASKELLFYNYTDGDYWVTTPINFELLRSVSRPLLYTYDIQLVCQRPISYPSAKQKAPTQTITGARLIR